TWAGEPEGEQLRVDWRWSTERILQRIRALAPVPGLALAIHAIDFFVVRAQRSSIPALALDPGEAAVQHGVVAIRTGDGAIAIERAVRADTEAELDAAALANLLAEHAPTRHGAKT
ncbi:MAG TPA: hypothetical protein VNN80_25040, partial [Polyangiaceae bacterium]|nr:hypothetical protein [Polyangiaceae bacterium]